MGKIRLSVPRLRQKRSGFYWQPAPATRALGFKPEALGRDLGKAVDRAQYLNDLVVAERRGSVTEAQVENVATLVVKYRESDAYLSLAPNTRPVYESVLRKIAKASGHLMVANIDRRGLVEMREKITRAKGRKRANAHLKIWRILLNEAMNMGWRKDNPAKGYGGADHSPRSRVWTPDEIDRFCAHAIKLGRQSVDLAVRLGHDTGQRQGDVIRFRWSDYDGHAIALQQAKTRARVSVPLSPTMITRLATEQRSAVQMVVNEATGRPYNPTTFRHLFRALRDAAGLPSSLQYRDLRRTTLTELGDAGATDDEIRAMSGHQNRNVVATYVVPSSTMAEAAQKKRTARQQKVGK